MAQIIRNDDAAVRYLFAVVLTFLTTNESTQGKEEEVPSGAGFGSNAGMVSCLSYEACATAQSLMPVHSRLLEFHHNAVFVLLDDCPSSPSLGLQQKVPCRGIPSKFIPSSKVVLAKLQKVASRPRRPRYHHQETYAPLN